MRCGRDGTATGRAAPRAEQRRREDDEKLLLAQVQEVRFDQLRAVELEKARKEREMRKQRRVAKTRVCEELRRVAHLVEWPWGTEATDVGFVGVTRATSGTDGPASSSAESDDFFSVRPVASSVALRVASHIVVTVAGRGGV